MLSGKVSNLRHRLGALRPRVATASVQLAVAGLRLLSGSRSKLLQRSAVTLVALAPISQSNRERLHAAAIAGSPAAKISGLGLRLGPSGPLIVRQTIDAGFTISGSSGGLPISLAEIERAKEGAFTDLTAASRVRLAAFRRLHVFLDGQASLQSLPLHDVLAGHELVVYAFGDRTAEIEMLGLAGRARIASLRDRFPDLSPEAEEVHRFSRRLARSVVDAASQGVEGPAADDLRRDPENFAQSLEDDLAWRLTLAECFRWAAREVPKEDGLVFVGRDAGLFPAALALLAKDIPADQLFVASDEAYAFKERQFWRAALALGSERDVVGNALPSASGQSIAPPATWLRLFSRKSTLAEDLGSSAAMQARGFEPGVAAAPVIVAYNPSVAAYAQTADDIAAGLIDHSGRSCIALAAAADAGKATRAATRFADDSRFQQMTTRFTAPLLASGLSESAKTSIVDWVAGHTGQAAIYDGIDVFPILREVVADFLDRKLFIALALRRFIRALRDRSGAAAMITVPSRYWPIRSMAGAFRLDGRAPVVDVQALNVIRHAKYVPPVADVATVIDRTAAEIYRDFLGFPETGIRLAGTPFNDRQKTLIEGLDRRAIAARLGLAPESDQRILMASQLQPFTRMGAVATALAGMVARSPGLEVIVKLHPREGEDRAQAYQKITDANDVGGRMIVVRDGDGRSEEMIAACDVCVTIYSNMARDAAIAGKPVVLALFDGWSPPIRFDREGLAVGAETVEAFTAAVERALSDVDRARESHDSAGTYFAANPHLKDGRSTERILDAAEEAIASRSGDGAGKPFRAKAQHLVIIAEATADATPLLKRPFAKADIFVPRAPAATSGVPSSVRYHSAELADLGEQAFEEAVARAQTITDHLCEHLIGCLEGSVAGARARALRYALWMMARPGLIDAATRDAAWRKGLAAATDHLIIVGRNPAFLDACTAYVQKRPQAQVSVVKASGAKAAAGSTSSAVDLSLIRRGLAALANAPSGTRTKMLRSLVVERLSRIPALRRVIAARTKQPPTMSTPDFAPTAFDGWLRTLRDINFHMLGGPVLLMTTGWHLKTVPATVLPVIERLPFGASILGMTVTADGHEAFATALQGTVTGESGQYLSPEHLDAMMPTRPAADIKGLGGLLAKRLDADPELAALTFPLEDALRSAADQLVRSGLWRALVWDEICRRALSHSHSVSAACPGRQWHTEVAHIRAKEAGRKSITIQNAYMTRGYTYTNPTGDVVTAIDTWSRDLFVSRYDVEPGRIVVCSTPRFDYLSRLKLTDLAAARTMLGLPDGTPMVLFAAQPGFDPATSATMRAFASFSYHRPVLFWIKLHPRSPAALADELEALAATFDTPHTFTVSRDGALDVLLSASDVVSTMFSNVGIEAAALGKPLVLINLLGETLPFPIDTFGIGQIALTASDVHDALEQLLGDPAARDKLRVTQDRFFANNPALRDGTSAETIAAIISGWMQADESTSAAQAPSFASHQRCLEDPRLP